MKSNFRQGVARHQTDVNGNPTFLQRSGGGGQYVDLIVSPQPTVLILAHREGTYVIEELKTVPNAWGPLTGPGTKYLYWDVNLLTGAVTRGMTLEPPLYTSAAPSSPLNDQHWFDTVENVFRVWNGSKWIEKIRVFAGSVTSNALIHPIHLGSQAGLLGSFEAGYILLDSFGMPLRQSNGTFATTSSWLNVVNLGTTTTRLDSTLMSAMAAEELPKFSLVRLQPGRRMVLARSTDYTSRVSGIVTEDLYEGEVSQIITTGLIRDASWSFSESTVNRPLFCGPTGQLTTVPPMQGALQQVGFVYDTDAIFIDLKQVIVLDDPNATPAPPPPPVSLPIANFTTDVIGGIAPLTVNFTSTSTGATSLEWDFVNDGFVDATTSSASYVYGTPGIYTVRLRAINTFGQDDEIKTNLISVTAPAPGPTNVNLGLTFNAPIQVVGGQPFNLQVLVSNDGLGHATNVTRELVLRASNGSQVTLTAPPIGTTVTYSGPLTKVTLPPVNINSGNVSSLTLQVNVAANATAVQIEGKVDSPQTDADKKDNKTSLTVRIRP